MKISVVVAVYNPGVHIDQLINSLLLQSMPAEDFEVIFVDDDSVDGTRERLQAFAAGQQNVTVFHNTPNSGWPGTPRNIGIEAAQGDYLFFVDHDDWLPAWALHDLWEFAETNRSDVVMPKEVGHGHVIPWATFRNTITHAQLGVDPLQVLPTPHRLFRRSLLDEHGIRFPEGKVRLEDHLFITKAHFAADTISIYSERPCYHWVHRDDTNASLRPFDPRDYYRDLDTVLDVVVANTEPGNLRNRLFHQWYSPNMLRRLASERFLGFPEDHQQVLFDEIRRIVDARFDPSMDDDLAPADSPRAHLVRGGRLDLIRELALVDVGVTSTPVLTQLRWDDDELVIGLSVTPTHADGAPLRFDDTTGRALRVLPEALAAQLPDHVRDMTDWLPKTTVGIILRDRSTHEVAELTVDDSTAVVRHGDHQVVVGTATARIDPRTGFGGRPLPRLLDVYSRFDTCGWRSERRVPFDPRFAEGGQTLVRSMDRAEISAYSTAGTANLSIKRLGQPPKPPPPPAPPKPEPVAVSTPSSPPEPQRPRAPETGLPPAQRIRRRAGKVLRSIRQNPRRTSR